MDSTEEVTGCIVAAGGNAAVLLQLVKELLNQVTCLVNMLVLVARLFAATLGPNYDDFPALCKGAMTGGLYCDGAIKVSGVFIYIRYAVGSSDY